MFRTLLTTTAFAALIATGAIAQDAAPATDAPAMDAPATTEAAPVAPTSLLATGYTITDRDNLATEIIGKQVYSSTANDAEHIGDINNLVVGEAGEVAAVVIGVGGFLGIGEKNVAVNYAELEWVTAEDGSERYVLPTTKEALEAAPDFEAVDGEDVAEAQADAEVEAQQDAMAPADNNAMAPADNAMAPADAPMDNAMTAEENNGIVTGPIDRDTLTDAPLTAEELIGTNAYGPGDEHLGAIGDVILGADGTSVEALIIDFGGFLGIGTKPVAVAIENVRYATDADAREYLFVNVTRDQLDAAVAYDAATFETARDTQLLATDPLT
jgi:sporulation protein YlmC with PRC-barrel domain